MIPIEDFIDTIVKEENTGYYDTAQTRNSDTNFDNNDSQHKKSEHQQPKIQFESKIRTTWD
jgi:hypothetical protein